MTKANTFYSREMILLRVFLDCLMIPIVLIAAYSIKFKVIWIMERVFQLHFSVVPSNAHAPLSLFLDNSLWVIVLWILTYFFLGVYRRFTGIMPEVDELIVVVKATTVVALEMVMATFIFGILPGSIYVLFYSWILGMGLMLGYRALLHQFELRLQKRGVAMARTLVIGSDEIGQDVVERILLFPSLGYTYVGSLDIGEPEKRHYHLRHHYKRLGAWSDYESVIHAEKISQVFVTRKPPEGFDLDALKRFCSTQEISLSVLSGETDYVMSYGKPYEFDGLTFTQYKEPSYRMIDLAMKRVFDIAFSLIFLMLTLPVFIVTALMIKLVSPSGPVFFVQERVTKNNKRFGMIKFRTMIPDAEKSSGPVMVNETQESRYLPFGGFLRKSSIDEWPQMINILKGEMSIIGPRPERPFFIDEFEKQGLQFSLRHAMKGGLTGWAQINGRSVLTRHPAHKLKYDLYYVKNWSLLLDVKIFLKTISMVLKKEEAY